MADGVSSVMQSTAAPRSHSLAVSWYGAVRTGTQHVDGVASCHRAANCAESNRTDRLAVPAAAARADCPTAHVRLH
jgi:hypothetical protein